MRLDIKLDDITYVGRDEEDVRSNPDKELHVIQAERFFAVLKRTASYMHHCEDGRVLLLGGIAVQRAHFLFCPSKKEEAEGQPAVPVVSTVPSLN